jgi:alpha-glucosidase (family GH31 glycosyl hydrolase)
MCVLLACIDNCRYGYTSLSEVEDIVSKYIAAEIPLDTQWMDIDYMQNYRDFTTDSVNFPTAEVGKFVDNLHANGMHFVPIIDPGIMTYGPNKGYPAYDDGVKEGLFIRDMTGNFYLSQVWPGPTYMPDFFHPSTQVIL